MITSRQHSIVKTFRRVARGDAFLALLDGWHLLHDALAAGLTIETVAVDDGLRDPSVTRMLDAIADAQVFRVSSGVMSAISPVRTPSGIVAIARRPLQSPAALFQPPPALVVVGSNLQDPGNVGAMIRSAEAGHATGVAFTRQSADPWGWKALRAAMGSTFRVPLFHHDEESAVVNACRAADLQIVATVPRHGESMHTFDWTRPTAVLLGGEGAGLSDEVISAADARVTIPMREPVESLNVAVAAALLVYEATRQRSNP